jgi:hypothetical protein
MMYISYLTEYKKAIIFGTAGNDYRVSDYCIYTHPIAETVTFTPPIILSPES